MTELNDDVLRPLVNSLPLERKVALLTGRDSWSLHPIPEIGLESLVLSDGPVGVRGPTWDERSPSINFPSPTALAASWDSDRARQVGAAIGSEAVDKGVHVVLAPTINLHRTPYGGRHFEAFSEDPLLTARVASAYVEGIQSRGVGATLKHYIANDSETDRFTVDVRVDEQVLRELYLLAFEQPVTESGAWLVMSAYNSINGATASENPLLTEPLVGEWNFDGVVVSDWTGVRSVDSALHPQHLAMPGPEGAWGTALVEAVRDGRVPEALIDEKVVRILRLAARTGVLAGHARSASALPLDPPLRRGIARRAASDGMVLLSNDGTLPLEHPLRISVIGEGARFARTQGGGSATVIPAHVVSPFEGIRECWPDAEVTWSRGAVVQQGLAELDPRTMRTADGRPGMTVRYLDHTGALLAEEHREASGIVSFDAAALASRSAVVEMRFRFSPEDGGDVVPLGLAGLCDYELIADGKVVHTGELRTETGDDPATAVLNPPHAITPVPLRGDGVDIVARFRPVPGGIPGALAFRVGAPPVEADAETLIAEAVAAALDADVVIVVVSTTAEVESEGFDRTTLALPGGQDAMVAAVATANPATVVIVNAGAPVLLPWRDDVAAILAVWFPGQEFGSALADVLSGTVEPGGRLPVTWPGTEDDLPVRDVTPVDGRLPYREGLDIGYRAWRASGAVPAYPFGHGLGYTSWRVDSVAGPLVLPAGGTVDVDVTATNTGSRAGKSVVQLYLERVDASAVARPPIWLAGFSPVVAGPWEQFTQTISLDWRRFAHWDGEWAVEAGDYRLRVGFSSSDLVAQLNIRAELEAAPELAVAAAPEN